MQEQAKRSRAGMRARLALTSRLGAPLCCCTVPLAPKAPRFARPGQWPRATRLRHARIVCFQEAWHGRFLAIIGGCRAPGRGGRLTMAAGGSACAREGREMSERT